MKSFGKLQAPPLNSKAIHGSAGKQVVLAKELMEQIESRIEWMRSDGKIS